MPVHDATARARSPNNPATTVNGLHVNTALAQVGAELGRRTMNRFQEAVAEFHHATGGPGTLDTPEGRLLRAKLIMEEAVETVAALGFHVTAEITPPKAEWSKDDLWIYMGPTEYFVKDYPKFHLLDYLDGLCDLTYVVMGGAVNANVNLERHFEEVHQANMRKLNGPKRADGKQLKPEGWVGPDHQKVLDTYVPHG